LGYVIRSAFHALFIVLDFEGRTTGQRFYQNEHGENNMRFKL